VTESADVERAVRELLELLVDRLGLDAEIDVRRDDDTVTGALIGDELGLFIGRHGQTIEAVQHLAQRVAFRGQPSDVRVVIDAAGYRDRRASLLRREADEAADNALRGDRPVALDAMIASERKLIHEYLRERGDVETYSEGMEPDRHLVVAPLGHG
jgi:spoIIIJ-associated protein